MPLKRNPTRHNPLDVDASITDVLSLVDEFEIPSSI